MRIIPEKLLKAWGVTVTKNMEQLQNCPICNETALHVAVSRVSNFTVFHCHHCHAQGDALDITAKVFNESINDALSRFQRGGTYYHTLVETFAANQLKEYINQFHSQANIRDYVEISHNRLQSHSGRVEAQSLPEFRGGVGHFPKTMGLVQPDQAPMELGKLRTGEYRKRPHFSFTYTYNGAVVGVNTRQLHATHSVNYHELVPEDGGVFMEDVASKGATDVFIAPSDLVAAALAVRYRHEHLNNLPVISTRSLPLPMSLGSATDLYLLSFHDHPLGLNTALKYFSERQVIEFAKAPNIWVINDRKNLQKVTAQTMVDWRRGRRSLLHWIAHELVRIYEIDGEPAVINALRGHKIDHMTENALRQQLANIKAYPELLDLLDQLRIDLTDERRLANNRRITRSIHGFQGYEGPMPIALSNTMIKVDQCTLTRSGEVDYGVTLHCSQCVEPVIQAVLPEKAFATANALTEAVRRAYMERGHNPNIVFYRVTGYDWREIRDIFQDCEAAYREIPRFGTDTDMCLQLPNVEIDLLKGETAPQGPLTSFPSDVVECYAALPAISRSEYPAFKELWSRNDASHGAFAAGITHLFSQVLQDAIATQQGNTHYPRHLVYVDLDKNTWVPTLKQLSTAFRGTPYLPNVPRTQTMRHLSEMADLGPLPYICALPNFQAQRAINVVQESPVSLLACTTATQGELVAGENSIWFISQEQMTPYKPGPIADELVDAIRQELPSILAEFVQKWHNHKSALRVLDTDPIVQVFDWIGDTFELNPSPQVANLCKKYYMQYPYQTARDFLYELRRIFYLGGSPYPPHRKIRDAEMPTEACAVFESTTYPYVWVHKNLMHVINEVNDKCTFNEETVTEELQEAGYLGENQEQYWVLHKTVWDTHVADSFKLVAFPNEEIEQAENA